MRAFLLLVVIATQAWLALPVPHKITAQSLRAPEAKEELARWIHVLRTLGVERSRKDIVADLEHWTTAVHSTWAKLSRPVAPAKRLLGFNQRWALFASPDTHPTVLVVSVHRDGTWHELYRRHDASKTFMKAELGFRRVRGVHDGVGQQPNPAWKQMADWILVRALTEHPAASRGRVQAVQMHSVAPPEPPDPQQTVLFSAIRTRKDLDL